MGLFDKLKKDKAPEPKPAPEKAPSFMDTLSKIQTHMVTVCNDYAKGRADKIYIWGNIDEGSVSSNCFYEVKGRMYHKHQMDEATGGKVDVSKERETQCLRDLNHDMVDFAATLKGAGQKIPYEVKLVYDAKKGSLDGHYEYPPVPDERKDMSGFDLFIEWFDQVSSGGAPLGAKAGDAAPKAAAAAEAAVEAGFDYAEFEKFVDTALSGEVPEEVVAICFNLYDDPGDRWSVEVVGTSAFDREDSDWACAEVTDFGTRKAPYAWTEEAEYEEIQEKSVEVVRKYLESGSCAEKLKAVEGIGVGFVDGDLELI
ncbi:MAG: hypothetical protein ACSW8G_04800 [Bacillota bacterium]